VSDYQLLRHKKHNGNTLCKEGLWAGSRHPNYLGEILQWWAIWIISLPIPYGLYLIFSPLLITFLIIKVSGIEPLEKKRLDQIDFQEYVESTPILFPTPFLNGLYYTIGWGVIVYFGAKGYPALPILIFVGVLLLQLFLFRKWDLKSLSLFLPLATYALTLALVQESLFIRFNLLSYPGQGVLPPFWLLSLYILFSMNLNSSLSFLNSSLCFSFFLGGVGALASYLTGEKLGGVVLRSTASYLPLILAWGLYLSLLTVLNRKLLTLWSTYKDSQDKPLTLFYDAKCPICSKEIANLKKRKETGVIHYVELSANSIDQFKAPFTFEEAMGKIHAIENKSSVLTGIDALSAVYARTNLLFLSILLQAPGLCPLFKGGYILWAKLRRHFTPI